VSTDVTSLSPALVRSASAAGGRRRDLEWICKRVADYAIALTALVVLSPLLILIALLIRLDSKGPILFRQQRLGLRGRIFWIWKFRTMVESAEQQMSALEPHNESQGGVLFKLKRDPRVTRLGRLLRTTSCDELPQIFNVLMGDMSIVGPRPLPLRDCLLLKELDEARFARRLEILPGLTGVWQVNGRSRVGAERMLGLDCDYVGRWTLKGDLLIILKTFAVLFCDREGAC
jgi:lipopolysaccharide/colanic/teichoic acid biosynthesis glycosyltransferase